MISKGGFREGFQRKFHKPLSIDKPIHDLYKNRVKWKFMDTVGSLNFLLIPIKIGRIFKA
jgi:hypothetical protein